MKFDPPRPPLAGVGVPTNVLPQEDSAICWKREEYFKSYLDFRTVVIDWFHYRCTPCEDWARTMKGYQKPVDEGTDVFSGLGRKHE